MVRLPLGPSAVTVMTLAPPRSTFVAVQASFRSRCRCRRDRWTRSPTTVPPRSAAVPAERDERRRRGRRRVARRRGDRHGRQPNGVRNGLIDSNSLWLRRIVPCSDRDRRGLDVDPGWFKAAKVRVSASVPPSAVTTPDVAVVVTAPVRASPHVQDRLIPQQPIEAGGDPQRIVAAVAVHLLRRSTVPQSTVNGAGLRRSKNRDALTPFGIHAEVFRAPLPTVTTACRYR